MQSTLENPPHEEETTPKEVILKGIPRSVQKKYGVGSDVKAIFSTSEETASGRCFVAKNRHGKEVRIDPSDFPKGSVKVERDTRKKPAQLLLS